MVSAAFMNMVIGAGKQYTTEYNDQRKKQLDLDAELIKAAQEAKSRKDELEFKAKTEEEAAKKEFEYNMALTGQKLESAESIAANKLDNNLEVEKARQEGRIDYLVTDKSLLDKTQSTVAGMNNDTRKLVATIASTTDLQINANNIDANFSLAQQKATDRLKEIYVNAGIAKEAREDEQSFKSEFQDAQIKATQILTNTKIQAGKDLQESKINFETWKVNNVNATNVLIQGTAAQRQDWAMVRQELAQSFQADQQDKRLDAQASLQNSRQSFLAALSKADHLNEMEKLEAIQSFDERMKKVDYKNTTELTKLKSDLLKDIDTNRINTRYDREKELTALKAGYESAALSEQGLAAMSGTENPLDNPRYKEVLDGIPRDLVQYLQPEDINAGYKIYQSKLKPARGQGITPYIGSGQAEATKVLIDRAKNNRDADLNEKQRKAAEVKANMEQTAQESKLTEQLSLSKSMSRDYQNYSEDTVLATPDVLMATLASKSTTGRLSPSTTNSMLNDAFSFYRTNPETKQALASGTIDTSAVKGSVIDIVKNLNVLRYAQYKDEVGFGKGVIVDDKIKKQAWDAIVSADARLDREFGRPEPTSKIEALDAIRDDNLRKEVAEVLLPFKPTSSTNPTPTGDIKPVNLEGENAPASAYYLKDGKKVPVPQEALSVLLTNKDPNTGEYRTKARYSGELMEGITYEYK
jgi:hypothetical protein